MAHIVILLLMCLAVGLEARPARLACPGSKRLLQRIATLQGRNVILRRHNARLLVENAKLLARVEGRPPASPHIDEPLARTTTWVEMPLLGSPRRLAENGKDHGAELFAKPDGLDSGPCHKED